MPRHDEHTRDRAGRLSELRREAAEAFNCSDPMTVAEKHLVECWSALKLGFEVLSAKLVGGNAVDAIDLIKLNEALAQYMPPRKQHEVSKLEVVFAPPTDAEAERLRLRDENAALRSALDVMKCELAKARGEEPSQTLSIPDSAITPPPRQLPAPSKADESAAMGWAAALGGPTSPVSAWSADRGYSDVENRGY
jgi:hypothetical protein